MEIRYRTFHPCFRLRLFAYEQDLEVQLAAISCGQKFICTVLEGTAAPGPHTLRFLNLLLHVRVAISLPPLRKAQHFGWLCLVVTTFGQAKAMTTSSSSAAASATSGTSFEDLLNGSAGTAAADSGQSFYTLLASIYTAAASFGIQFLVFVLLRMRLSRI